MEFLFSCGMFRLHAFIPLLQHQKWSGDTFVTSLQSEANLSERLSNVNEMLIHESL